LVGPEAAQFMGTYSRLYEILAQQQAVKECSSLNRKSSAAASSATSGFTNVWGLSTTPLEDGSGNCSRIVAASDFVSAQRFTGQDY